MDMKIVTVVRAVIKFTGKFLLLEQVNASGNTYLLFPGGHVSAGESLTDALVREVNEELNITDVRPTKLVYVKETVSPFDRNFEFFFECSTNMRIEDVLVKQREFVGYEKIKKYVLKDKEDLLSKQNFFPEKFFSGMNYELLELDLNAYKMRFGKDRNIKKLEENES